MQFKPAIYELSLSSASIDVRHHAANHTSATTKTATTCIILTLINLTVVTFWTL